ncbi:MAG: serine protease [Treponema sp.]|nr:serine protease [Treponema sp.]
MKKVFMLISLLFLQFICTAQVMKYVCIVRPNYSEKLIGDMLEFVPRFEKLGIAEPEKKLREFVDSGISGSGFVYVAPDGKNYIITNRHVIADAKTSSISFQDKEGNFSQTFSGLTILAADAEYDLAILAFPNDERPFDSCIDFSDEELDDGESVYTAGFPGLLGKPTWQFGSGIITNSSIKIPELLNPEISPVIQHSAQIDAGNSGGPLLIKNKEGNYKVIGVNTWKITNRQDTNFSIPSSTVKKFIDKALAGEKISTRPDDQLILEKAIELQKILNRFEVTFEELINFISIDYIEEEGKAIFDIAYTKCNEQNRKTLKEILVNYSPIMGMRYAIGWHLYSEFHKDEYKLANNQKSSVNEDKLPEVPAPIKYDDSDIWYTSFFLNYTRSYAKSEWVYSNGGWGLYSFTKTYKGKLAEKTRRNEKKVKVEIKREIPEGKLFYTPNIISLGYGALFPFNNSFSHELDLDVKVIDMLALDITGIINENMSPVLYYKDYNPSINSYEAYAGVQLQFPITKNRYSFVPYISLQGGGEIMNAKEISFVPTVRTDAGGKFCLFAGRSNFNFFVGAAASLKMDFESFEPDFGARVYGGISF